MGAKDLAENKNFFVKHTLIEPGNYEESLSSVNEEEEDEVNHTSHPYKLPTS